MRQQSGAPTPARQASERSRLHRTNSWELPLALTRCLALIIFTVKLKWWVTDGQYLVQCLDPDHAYQNITIEPCYCCWPTQRSKRSRQYKYCGCQQCCCQPGKQQSTEDQPPNISSEQNSLKRKQRTTTVSPHNHHNINNFGTFETTLRHL